MCAGAGAAGAVGLQLLLLALLGRSNVSTPDTRGMSCRQVETSSAGLRLEGYVYCTTLSDMSCLVLPADVQTTSRVTQ